MKKISFSGLKKVLTPKEMKNITGGSDCSPTNCGGMTVHCSGSCWADAWCAGCDNGNKACCN